MNSGRQRLVRIKALQVKVKACYADMTRCDNGSIFDVAAATKCGQTLIYVDELASAPVIADPASLAVSLSKRLVRKAPLMQPDWTTAVSEFEAISSSSAHKKSVNAKSTESLNVEVETSHTLGLSSELTRQYIRLMNKN